MLSDFTFGLSHPTTLRCCRRAWGLHLERGGASVPPFQLTLPCCFLLMPAPKRYFDNDSSAGPSPAKRSRGDGPSQRGGRGRGRGGGGGRGGGRGGHGGQRGPPREKKEPFKSKDGFISAGLKA